MDDRESRSLALIMNATYFPETRQLTVTLSYENWPMHLPLDVLKTYVVSRWKLRDALSKLGLRVAPGSHWRKVCIGRFYRAKLCEVVR